MNALHVPRALCVCVALSLLITVSAASVNQSEPLPSVLEDDVLDNKKIELFDGVSVKIPKSEDRDRKMLSLEINTGKDVETGRGKQKKLMQRILPMFIIPFLIQSTIVPFFLSMLKFMLFKSLMVGKLALGLILLNAFKNHNAVKGRNDPDIANIHYGYQKHGMEYGAYVN
ncbi:uncharacterized protein LOC113227042 [Hyposmocoma kahamanoa]|uniref:uncharacterized protein LOC113227042 n=1 Tax=Hyposmocoma kahamanoa TaxID=1477025 RepID=UPI000E6D93AD|nr:uncharacterized protein LOC113227042 [Hyposmocoma kahamanoa]